MSDTGFEKILADIEQQLTDEQQILDGIEERLALSRERVKRLTQAKQNLSGEKPTTSRKRRGRPASSDGWSPSPESIQAVMTTLSESSEPMTLKEIEAATGRSHSHIDSVVRYLKQHELIRLYGKRGVASIYTSMPTTGLKETDDALAVA
jgi:hypothetical protein